MRLGATRRRSLVRAIAAPEKTEKAANGSVTAATLRKLGDSDLLVSGKHLGPLDALLSMVTAAVFRSVA